MKVTKKDLEFDKDFDVNRAKELELYQLRLDLPDELEVTGYTFENRLLIRKKQREARHSSQH